MIPISERNNALKIIAEHLAQSGAMMFIQAQHTDKGRVLIKAWFDETDILDIVSPPHECTFALYASSGTKYASSGTKKCVDCGRVVPLFDLEIKHQR